MTTYSHEVVKALAHGQFGQIAQFRNAEDANLFAYVKMERTGVVHRARHRNANELAQEAHLLCPEPTGPRHDMGQ